MRHYRARLGRFLALSAFVVLLLSSGQCLGDELLHLWQKNPRTWAIVMEGGEGVLTFNRETGQYQFQGRRLQPEKGYALIRYTGHAPYGHIVARAGSDNQGQLNFAGKWHEWTGKFWLVLGTDVAGVPGGFGPAGIDHLESWHPRDYLFEAEELISEDK